MIWRRLSLLCLFVVVVGSCGRERESQPEIERRGAPLTVPAGFSNETFVTGLSGATAMAFAPDGRLFVCEQAGKLRVVDNGALLATPFVTVPVDAAGERGLLGVAFDPAFASNGFVYVYYTARSPTLHNRLSRFTAAGNTAVAGSEVVLLELDPLTSATNHNGGALAFGGDGKLYVAVGENALPANAQTTANLLGKLLRLNADGSIPADNPFFTTATGKNRAIWALGLRNPFTFAVQPGTGVIFVNDVGQGSWEEINRGAAGANYGWPTTEGATTDARFKSPVAVYGHGDGATTGCAIAGGTFYDPTGAGFPSGYIGKYFFADYCSGWLRLFDPVTGVMSTFASGLAAPVDLDVGGDGALYYLARGTGTVGSIRAAAGTAPRITAPPQDATRAGGQSATFTVTAAGDAPLSYQWQRNGGDIAGATAASYTTAPVSPSDSGALFRAVVKNPFGTATSAEARLTVTAGGPPTPVIVTPVVGATYAAGQLLTFSGAAHDPEDGPLPASAFTWEVAFHHDTHTHPFLSPLGGVTGGAGSLPNRGETATNVFYRVRLTVVDSSGLSATTFRDVFPRVATLSLATLPPGLQVLVDGQPLATPAVVSSVVGTIRTLAVVSPQLSGGVSHAFAAWSDGGAAAHELTTPEAGGIFTATFSPAVNVIPAGGGTVTGTTAGPSARTAPCAAESALAPEQLFTWTPTASGTATVHTCNPAVSFDTVLSIAQQGTATPALACNDDSSGCATGDPSANAGHHGSRLTLPVVAGRTYTIAVDGFAGSSGGAQGNFALTVIAPPPAPLPDAGTSPPDGGSGLPTTLPAAGGSVTGATAGASRSAGSCAAGPTGAAPEQIFRWTPSRSGRATASTCSSEVEFDTVLYVRTAGGGQELACNDDSSGCATGDGSPNAHQHGSRIAFDVVAGQTYDLVVDGYAGSTGGASGPLLLTVTSP